MRARPLTLRSLEEDEEKETEEEAVPTESSLDSCVAPFLGKIDSSRQRRWPHLLLLLLLPESLQFVRPYEKGSGRKGRKRKRRMKVAKGTKTVNLHGFS